MSKRKVSSSAEEKRKRKRRARAKSEDDADTVTCTHRGFLVTFHLTEPYVPITVCEEDDCEKDIYLAYMLKRPLATLQWSTVRGRKGTEVKVPSFYQRKAWAQCDLKQIPSHPFNEHAQQSAVKKCARKQLWKKYAEHVVDEFVLGTKDESGAVTNNNALFQSPYGVEGFWIDYAYEVVRLVRNKIARQQCTEKLNTMQPVSLCSANVTRHE